MSTTNMPGCILTHYEAAMRIRTNNLTRVAVWAVSADKGGGEAGWSECRRSRPRGWLISFEEVPDRVNGLAQGLWGTP